MTIEVEYDETPTESPAAEEISQESPTEDIKAESSQESPASHNDVQETTEVDWSSLKVKNLNKDERKKIIQDHEAGVENPWFKVQQLKNGSVRIIKRSNPLTSDNTETKISEKYTGKRLTNEQLLMEHIIDLEKRYETMRLKHKKLKKRYNKLEMDLFESDDEEVPAEVSAERDEVIENPVKVAEPETFPQESIITATFRKKPGKVAWRSMITRM